jgi:hypothetical protein
MKPTSAAIRIERLPFQRGTISSALEWLPDGAVSRRRLQSRRENVRIGD